MVSAAQPPRGPGKYKVDVLIRMISQGWLSLSDTSILFGGGHRSLYHAWSPMRKRLHPVQVGNTLRVDEDEILYILRTVDEGGTTEAEKLQKHIDRDLAHALLISYQYNKVLLEQGRQGGILDDR